MILPTKSTILDPSVPFQRTKVKPILIITLTKDHTLFPTTNTTSSSTSTRGRPAVVETMLSFKSLGKTCPKAVVIHSSLQVQPPQVPWRCSCRSRQQHKPRSIENKSSCPKSRSPHLRVRNVGTLQAKRHWYLILNKQIKATSKSLWAPILPYSSQASV